MELKERKEKRRRSQAGIESGERHTEECGIDGIVQGCVGYAAVTRQYAISTT